MIIYVVMRHDDESFVESLWPSQSSADARLAELHARPVSGHYAVEAHILKPEHPTPVYVQTLLRELATLTDAKCHCHDDVHYPSCKVNRRRVVVAILIEQGCHREVNDIIIQQGTR